MPGHRWTCSRRPNRPHQRVREDAPATLALEHNARPPLASGQQTAAAAKVGGQAGRRAGGQAGGQTGGLRRATHYLPLPLRPLLSQVLGSLTEPRQLYLDRLPAAVWRKIFTWGGGAAT